MSETQEAVTEETQPATKQVDPKDMKFLIDGAQVNAIFAELGKLPYEKVFQTMDVLRSLKRVEVKINEETESA
jgi:membrane protease subunit (stomatin/prohibitin family)